MILKEPFAYYGKFRSYVGWRLHAIVLFAIVTAATGGFGITLLVPLLGALDLGTRLPAEDGSGLLNVLEGVGLNLSLSGILLLIGSVFLAKAGLGFAQGVFIAHAQARLSKELKERVFDAYAGMSLSYYVSRDTGHFINIIGPQTGAVFAAIMTYTGFLQSVVNAFVYLGLAVALSWQFGLLAIVVGLTMLTTFRGLNRHVRNLSLRTVRESSHQSKLLVQVVQNYKYLLATDMVSRIRSGVMASIDKTLKYGLHQSLWATVTTVITEPISVGFVIGIIVFQVSVLNEPLAPLLVAILLFHRGLSTVLSVQGAWQGVMSRMGSVDIVEEELRLLANNQEKSGGFNIEPFNGAIELQEVSFRYDKAVRDAVSKVSLRIMARSTVALVGESGSGKSTMLDLLTLMQRPIAGRLVIDGVDSLNVAVRSWRRQIGFVCQDSVVFDDSIQANIAMREFEAGVEPDTMQDVIDAAKAAYLHDFVLTLPDGYDTIVGDRGIRLSGGQRQRLFIARELFKKPRVLILDEATSALDSQTERSIQESIDALKGSITVIVVAHRLSTIRNASQIFVMEAGRLVESGGYEELVTRPSGVFARMVEMQSLGQVKDTPDDGV